MPGLGGGGGDYVSVDSLLLLHSSLFFSGACGGGGGDYVSVDSLLLLHSSLFCSGAWGGGGGGLRECCLPLAFA